jgi:hypothetical protein
MILSLTNSSAGAVFCDPLDAVVELSRYAAGFLGPSLTAVIEA